MDDATEHHRRDFQASPRATIHFGLMGGSILDANDAALALYGYHRSEMIGLPYAALSADPKKKVHVRKDGSLFVSEIERSTMIMDGREVGVAHIREISIP